MLVDSITFTDTASLRNDRIETVTELPNTNLINGRQVELSIAQGGNPAGFYVYYSGMWNALISKTYADNTFSTKQELSEIHKVTRLNFIGNIVVTTGSARWYPETSINVLSVFLTIGVPSPGNTVVTLLKNGQPVLTGITIPINSYKSEITACSISLTSSDYLTASITAASGGKDLTLTLTYQ